MTRAKSTDVVPEGRPPRLHHKMPKNQKSGVFSIDERRRFVSQEYLKGKTQWEIAEAAGVGQRTVSEDILWIREQWKKSAIGNFDERVLEQLAKLDFLEQCHWEAWLKSCEAAETKVRKRVKELREMTVMDSPDKPKPKRTEAAELIVVKELLEKTTRGQTGDPRFLTEIREIVNMRLKLFGAYPKETGGSVNVFNINWDALVGRDDSPDPVAQRLVQIEAMTAPAPPASSPQSSSPGQKNKK